MYEQNNSNTIPNANPYPFTSAANNTLLSLQGHSRSATNAAQPSSPAELPQNIFTTPAIQPTSVVNLSNSSDVVIGPMTQYQGSVTIYQYMDATMEARSMQSNGGGINASRNTTNTTALQKLTTTSKLLILLIVLVILVAGVIVYIQLSKDTVIKEPEPILFGNNYEHGT